MNIRVRAITLYRRLRHPHCTHPWKQYNLDDPDHAHCATCWRPR